ncbi:MAG: SulP family inorganic anion transporter [Humidesulfovibrio sp.]|uniref:SulP family inorganic anion transporter n=1 Tax=Humidesulfovibrio sp. TaxID=2910988 RepID=UPI00273281C9|nr:SulP family inorganic anion transporter [Humidesulfovibrio sp.]MDP2848256.1 SulP family inorganic anion transporter [Humidesulfovibrio sp.]
MEQCELPQPKTAWRKASEAAPRYLPFLSWWPKVTRRTLKADLWAGLTGAVIVLPQGVAFAAIAGLPPQYGLYAAMVPVVIAALFGSSLHLVSGPTTAISLVILANVSHFADPGSAEYIRLVLTLTFLAGLFQLGLGLARMGAVVNFVSHSVVTGFTAGAAILIATSQLGGFFGLTLPRGGSVVAAWGRLIAQLPDFNPYVTAIGAGTMLTALAIRRLNPRLPALLMAMLTASVGNHLVNGAAHGVTLMGALPDVLPPLSLPVPGFDEVRLLVPGALAIAMLGLAEAVSIARAVAARSQQMIDNSQEFVGQGLANVIGSFFSAYASSGSFTRTGLNFESGAKTPLAAVFSALLLAAIVLLVAPLTAYLPLAAMSGVILLVAVNLVDQHGIRHILRTDKSEAGVLVVTFLATLFVQMEFAIFCGVILSLLMYLKRTSHPSFVVLAPDPDNLRRPLVNVERKPVKECPQLKILRLDGSIFFGAVTHISEELHRIMNTFPEQCHILIVGSGINFIDASGCHMLFNEALSLKLSGRDMFFCSLKTDVREVLKRGMCLKRLGGEHIFESEGQAIALMVQRLDPERCACCHLRVFRECERMPGGEHYLPLKSSV